MIRITTTVMDACAVLLERIQQGVFKSTSDMLSISIYQLRSEDIADLAYTCGWIIGEDISITPRGGCILNACAHSPEQYAMILWDYVLKCKPTWAYRIPYGRKETSLFMSKDEMACLSEANLLSSAPTESTIDWWDGLADIIRHQSQQARSELGRKGERLTMAFERHRTGNDPSWKAIESNRAGYDVQSVVDGGCLEPLLIEVKTSSDAIDFATFHVTANEWKTACNSRNYVFHLWLVKNKQPLLAIIEPDQISPHIPSNCNEGKWETAEIPYSLYTGCFNTITLEDERNG